jgi:hypothetical protein
MDDGDSMASPPPVTACVRYQIEIPNPLIFFQEVPAKVLPIDLTTQSMAFSFAGTLYKIPYIASASYALWVQRLAV